MTSDRFIANLPFFSGAVLVCALVMALRTLHLLRNGIRVEGKVVEIDRSNEGDTPIVGFQAQDGKEYRFRVSTVLGKERWDLDTRWPVVYLGSSPKFAEVERFPQLWGGPIIFAAAGSVSFIVLTLIRFFWTIK